MVAYISGTTLDPSGERGRKVGDSLVQQEVGSKTLAKSFD